MMSKPHPGWDHLWRGRAVPPPAGDALADLLAADGFDSGFAAMTPQAWSAGVRRVAAALRLAPGASVYEVGCGAGAWLFELERAGHPVAGLDLSPALIARAGEALPNGTFTVGDALTVEPEPLADAVVSFGVFMYFSSAAYAEAVLDRMVTKARHAVAILDLPDAATREADLERRTRLAGGAEAYAERYAGLDQRYYDRDWVADALRARGLVDVHTEGQSIEGYANAPYRFNAWGFKP